MARELLGKIVAVRAGRRWLAARIVETEAYRANDPASHSCRGETPRSAIMFGAPGFAYVYFIYGMYEMLNFVTEPRGAPGAVLLRAASPLPAGDPAFLAGPGKLCRGLGVRLDHNGESLAGPKLLALDDGFRPESVSVSPRVGIRVATEKPWRFFLTGNPAVSRAPQNRVAVILGGNP